MNPEDRNKLRGRVVSAAEATLTRQGYVSAIDVLTGIGWLDPAILKRWRQGQLTQIDEYSDERGRVHLELADATPAEAARGMALVTKLVG